jgi:hypothetical protein
VNTSRSDSNLKINSGAYPRTPAKTTGTPAGIFNVIVMPDIFEANRLTIVRSPYLLVEGPLQKYEGVIHVQARKIEAISLSAGAAFVT